jgi:hypothetical protein
MSPYYKNGANEIKANQEKMEALTKTGQEQTRTEIKTEKK